MHRGSPSRLTTGEKKKKSPDSFLLLNIASTLTISEFTKKRQIWVLPIKMSKVFHEPTDA